MVELLTVLTIIALMVGILLPALTMVRNTAKEARQKTQLATIGQAIMAFKGDYGDYPQSNNNGGDYGGAQKLCEALMGWDLMGFHPKSEWMSNGKDAANINWIYPQRPMDLTIQWVRDNLDQRKGPYLDRATANAFALGSSIAGAQDGLFNRVDVSAAGLNPDTYVLCDSFPVKKLTFVSGTKIEVVTAGTPILYYKAETTSKQWGPPGQINKRIYFDGDNRTLVSLRKMTDKTISGIHPLGNDDASFPSMGYGAFYHYLIDQKMVPVMGQYGWPVNSDSYVLISAGADGLYGTADDIKN